VLQVENNNNSDAVRDASVFAQQMCSKQEDSMVLDGSFGRTQRISQSEEGKPHSAVSLVCTSSTASDLSFHKLPTGLSIRCMNETDNVTYTSNFSLSLHKKALQAPSQ
jgi:hypothetical protein